MNLAHIIEEVDEFPQTFAEHIQVENERRYNRKLINNDIDMAIRDNPINEAKVQHGMLLITEWLAGTYYASKQARLSQLDPLCIEQLVRDVFINIAYLQAHELFVSTSAQLAMRMGFDDHRDSILTMAEALGVLCETDAFDICKESKQASMTVISQLDLPKEVLDSIDRSQYLPPLVCEPGILTNNYESPYLTHNDSLILGRGNSHSGDICLDVINSLNGITLCINEEFLNSVEEVPTHDLDTPEKVQQWDKFLAQSKQVYELMLKQGNQFWLTNKPDKRGRFYSQGYHITTQGSAFKKAMLDLHHKEIVEGVPT